MIIQKTKFKNQNLTFLNFDLLFWFLIFGLWISFPAWGGEPKITVHVEAKEEASLDTTSHAEVLIPSKIPGVAKTVPKLLERVAGVHIKRYGDLDDFAQVSIRGSTTDQVLIYLDGILLNTAAGGVIDLSLIPLDQVAKIEIYKGGSPGKVVDSTPGGVIYIHTRGKPEKTKNLVGNSLGSFYTYRGHAQRTQAIRDFYYNTSFNYFQSRGDFSFLDDRGTRTNRADDRITLRQNNDFETFDAIASVGKESKSGLDWKIYENFFHKEQGVPGLGSRTSLLARLKTLRNFLHAKIENPSEGKKIQWASHLFFDLLQNKFSDPQGEIGVGVQNNEDVTLRFGPQFQVTTQLANHLLNGFLAHRGEFFWPTNHTATNPEGPLSQRHMIAMGLQDEIPLFQEKLIFDLSGRVQNFINDLSGQDPSFATQAPDNTVTDTQMSAKIGAKYSPLHFLSFKMNLFRGFRQPTFNELFGDRGALVGNPALTPEEAFNFDIGASVKFSQIGVVDRLFIEANFYRHAINNLIQFLQNSQFTAKAQNLNDARIFGTEFSATLQAFKNLKVATHYVHQQAKDSETNSPTNGNFLPGRPKHQFFLEGEYQYRWIKPFAEWQILSHNFLDAQNLLRVDRRSLLTAGIEILPHKNIKVGFMAKNLLNDRIADIAGFPLPGRSYWGEIEINL